MSFINEQEKKVAALLSQAGVPRFTYFIYIIFGATVAAGFGIQSEIANIDWSDWGAIAIMATAAVTCYSFIWLYIKKITQKSDK